MKSELLDALVNEHKGFHISSMALSSQTDGIPIVYRNGNPVFKDYILSSESFPLNSF
jgi:hypothetical protein